MEAILSTDRESKTKARILTAIFTILFFIILLLPWFSYQNPPPGQEGTIINLGMLNMGQGDENAPETEANAAATEAEEEQQEQAKKAEPEKVKKPNKPKKEKPASSSKQPSTKKEVIQEDNNEAALALAKKNEKEKAQKKAKFAAEEAAKKKADEKAKLAKALKLKKQKEAEEAKQAKARAVAQAEADAQAHKSKLKGLFDSDGGGSGEGKGETGKPGNQGNKNGDPNADALKGISSGSGVVSGGLAGRGGSGPGISDNSNKTGVVVIEVCVDPSGNVTKASFTQRGSSTSDKTLVKLAEENARKWSFKTGMQDKQCGTIKYEFKVK